MEKFKRYEYDLENGETGSYTIKFGVKPLGYKRERLVQKFMYDTEKHIEIESWN